MTFMKNFSNKLIVLRGNSGSGKSTIAKKLRDAFPNSKFALVEQDYIRRIILREKGSVSGSNNMLIRKTVEFCLQNNYDVILEGILNWKTHKKIFNYLIKRCPNNYFFYFDVSLEETLKRSENKHNYKDFGPEKVKSWYIQNDLTNFKNEFIIPENFSEQQSMEFIIKKTGLK